MSRRPLLSWWPFNPTEWMELTQLMAPEAQAAVMRLNCAAWKNATKPAHLPDDASILSAASGLSAASWKRYKATILEHFPVAERGWRTASLIADVFDEQSRKYEGALRGLANKGRNTQAETSETARDETFESYQQRIANGETGSSSSGKAPPDTERQASRQAQRQASRSASRNAPTEVRTTQRADFLALQESQEKSAISEYNPSSSTAPYGESASSPACAPLQGAPPPPLGESTNREPQQQPRGPALHTEPAPSDDDDWEQVAPRVPQRAHAPMAPIGAILGSILPQSSPDNAA